jgi:hypothetical protein
MLKNEPTDIKKSDERLYGIYRAVVVENDDSYEWDFTGGSGRVRVRIWGLHTSETSKTDDEGIPQDECPWAEPAYPVIEGSLTDYGMWSVPVIGTHVFVFFENGDHMKPKYFACAPGIQPEKYPDDSGFFNSDWIINDRKEEPDYSRIARGEIEGTFIESINDDLINRNGSCGSGVEEKELSIGEYPHILSLETHGGHAMVFDSSEDKRFLLYHPKKSYISIDPDGDVTIRSGNDIIIISTGSKKISVDNNTEIVGGDWTIDVAGDANIFASSVFLGDCNGHRALAFANHIHTGVARGGAETDPCIDNTENVVAT